MDPYADSKCSRREGWHEVQRAPHRTRWSVEHCENALTGVFCTVTSILREHRIDEFDHARPAGSASARHPP
jgi:hypothetical protein